MFWIKPSGLEIETNDLKATVKYCKSLGWKIKGGTEEKEPVKRKRRTKEEMAAARK